MPTVRSIPWFVDFDGCEPLTVEAQPRATRYLRALGATRREPDQSLAAHTLDVWARPAVGAASPMSLGSTWPGLPAFGVSSQM